MKETNFQLKNNPLQSRFVLLWKTWSISGWQRLALLFPEAFPAGLERTENTVSHIITHTYTHPFSSTERWRRINKPTQFYIVSPGNLYLYICVCLQYVPDLRKDALKNSSFKLKGRDASVDLIQMFDWMPISIY